MIKFIHTGDIHLGLQFTGVNFDSRIADKRRVELWSTFQRIVNRAIEEQVDFLFIAGDLYEEQYFTLADIKRVRDTLAEAKNIDIIITAGNHDALKLHSLYRMVEWPKNVHIFNAGELSKKEFDIKNACIYGYSWDEREITHNVFPDFEGIDKDKINVLIIHGDILDKRSPYLPLDKNYLRQLGFDYIALGHIHKPDIISKKMAYCGSPEPLHFGELDEHGIIEGTVERGNTQIKFVPFSLRKFIINSININETMNYIGILNMIKESDSIEETKRNLYRIKLQGIINRDVAPYIQDLEKDLEDYFYYLEIIDDTNMDYDLDSLELQNQDNIIGYFIKAMKEEDLEDRVVRDALYIGLDSLMKGKVDR